MIGLISQNQFKFDNLTWKYQAILAQIPDPAEQILNKVLHVLQEPMHWKYDLEDHMIILNLIF